MKSILNNKINNMEKILRNVAMFFVLCISFVLVINTYLSVKVLNYLIDLYDKLSRFLCIEFTNAGYNYSYKTYAWSFNKKFIGLIGKILNKVI